MRSILCSSRRSPLMTRCNFACYLSLFCVCLGMFGQVAKTQQPPAAPQAIDTEYRKFDEVLSALRTRIAQQYAIDSAKGVDEAMYVHLGGIEQWVTIRGEDRQNPVLLFVHGGPGDVTNPWSFAYFAAWEKRFTVVQWDERGAGRTLRKTGPSVASTMTLDRMAQDGIELSEFLWKHLGKPRIVLVAHSFGSILGLRMVQARPDLFYAYVGTGQVSDETKNYSVAYAALLERARATGNQQAVAELRRIGAPPYSNGEGYGVQRKWANRFEGADRFLAGTLGLDHPYCARKAISRCNQSSTQRVCADRRRSLCGVYELGSISQGTCRACSAACERPLNPAVDSQLLRRGQSSVGRRK